MRILFLIFTVFIHGCLFFDSSAPLATNNLETNNNGDTNNGANIEETNNGVTVGNNGRDCPDSEKVNDVCLPDCSKNASLTIPCNLVCDEKCALGSTCFPCLGARCNNDAQCPGGVCNGSVCQEQNQQCWDGERSEGGGETDLDCGGGDCQPCGEGLDCKSNRDCEDGLVCNPNKTCEKVFKSCEDAVKSQPVARSGIYLIEVDQGPVQMFCHTRFGGVALLMVAQKDSTYWGAESDQWGRIARKGNLPRATLNVTADQKTDAYSVLETKTIFLCLLKNQATACFQFNLDVKRTLMSFFVEGETHTKYQNGTSVPPFAQSYLNAFGYSMSSPATNCFRLGINHIASKAKIGLMGGSGDACNANGDRALNYIGLGVGLDFDASNGDHENKAGITRYITSNGSADGEGPESYLLGPWAIFAK